MRCSACNEQIGGSVRFKPNGARVFCLGCYAELFEGNTKRAVEDIMADSANISNAASPSGKLDDDMSFHRVVRLIEDDATDSR